ncbi:transposase [Cellulosimicrobium cellulans]|nr:transposase [Cellulosimicrobium cellulans]
MAGAARGFAGTVASRRAARHGRDEHRRRARAGARRGDHVGPSPDDRVRPYSKHHLIVDANGTPLQGSVTGGNRHDATQLLPMVDALPAIRGVVGRTRREPRRQYAHRGYDYDLYRRRLRARSITPKIARRGVARGSGLGKKRWVVERRFAWLH